MRCAVDVPVAFQEQKISLAPVTVLEALLIYYSVSNNLSLTGFCGPHGWLLLPLLQMGD